MKKLSRFLFIIFLIPGFVMSETRFCFKSEIVIYCEAEVDDNYSLDGYFVKDGKHHEFSARRAFDGRWCQKSLKQIQEVVRSGKYCMGLDEHGDDLGLTINWVKSNAMEWSYFK